MKSEHHPPAEPPISSRDKILDAASRAFAEEGFAGARVDEIALQAGVNKALLYYHVGNKQELYTAVLTRNFDRMEAVLAEVLDSDGSASERLRALIIAVNRMLKNLPDHSRIVLREFASAGNHLQPEILERMVRIIGTVRGLLAEGVQEGEFRSTNKVMTHLTLIGASLVLNSLGPLRDRVAELGPGLGLPDKNQDIGEFLADLLLNGITNPATGESP